MVTDKKDKVEEIEESKSTKKQNTPIGYEVTLYTLDSSTSKGHVIAVIEWRADTKKVDIAMIHKGPQAEVRRFMERVIQINDEVFNATDDPKAWIMNLSNVPYGALWQNWAASKAKEIK